jgi:hypothetical protein
MKRFIAGAAETRCSVNKSTRRARFAAISFLVALMGLGFYPDSSASSIGSFPLGKGFNPATVAGSGSFKSAVPAAKRLPGRTAIKSFSADLPVAELADLNIARQGHTATRLADGRILIVGGQNDEGSVRRSEIFNPATRSFSLAAKTIVSRTDHAAIRIDGNRVLITGGNRRNKALTSTEIFDSATGAFIRGPSMHRARGPQYDTAG